MERAFLNEYPDPPYPAPSQSKITWQENESLARNLMGEFLDPLGRKLPQRAVSDNNVNLRATKGLEQEMEFQYEFVAPTDWRRYIWVLKNSPPLPRRNMNILDLRSESKSRSKTTCRSRGTRGSLQGLTGVAGSEKDKFHCLRSKSVYKEEKAELSKKVGKIFGRYNVTDDVVNKRMKILYRKQRPTGADELRIEENTGES